MGRWRDVKRREDGMGMGKRGERREQVTKGGEERGTGVSEGEGERGREEGKEVAKGEEERVRRE